METIFMTATVILGVIFTVGYGIKSSRAIMQEIERTSKLADAIATSINELKAEAAAVEGTLKEFIKETETAAAAVSIDAISEPLDLSSEYQEKIRLLSEEKEALSAQVIRGNLDAQALASHIEQLGRGEIPEKITEEYSGEFNNLRNSINSCIDGLGGLVEEVNILKRMSFNDYSVKITGSHSGIFGEMSESINMVSDRIQNLLRVLGEIAAGNLTSLTELSQIGKRSANDTLMPTVISMMESMR